MANNRPVTLFLGSGVNFRHGSKRHKDVDKRDPVGQYLTEDENPWNFYRRRYSVTPGSYTAVPPQEIIIAQRGLQMVSIRSYKQTDDLLKTLVPLDHDNIQKILQVYLYEGMLYTVCHRHTVSLGQIVSCPHYPNETHIKALSTQVRPGPGIVGTLTPFTSSWRPLTSSTPKDIATGLSQTLVCL